ncbi:MAG: Gfo/Idh/MocA family oxidoreductase [Bacteroidota bacterium]
MHESMQIAVIGCGRWGINHVRTAYGLLGERLRYVFDTNPQAEERVKHIAASIPFTTDISQILNDDSIRGVIIATPAETHYSVAKQCLERGKHVLVEKPITLLVSQAEELQQIALKNNLRLMVGHVLLFHPAVVTMKRMVDAGKIGKLQYIYSNRLNLGAIRSEENVLWSFAPHDISIIQLLTGTIPTEVASHGAQFVQDGIEDTTITYLKYPGNVHAHIFVSWLHPFKEQRMVVIGDAGMFVFEDSLPADKLKFYPKGFKQTASGIQKFEGEYESIPFDTAQPLAEEHKHFYDCITNNKRPLADGQHAIDVLKILDEATKRLHHV